MLYYTFLSKPVYESTARLVIDFRAGSNSLGTIDFTGFTSASKITNEIETLTSYVLTEGVANALAKKKYLDKAKKTIAPILLSSSMRMGKIRLHPIREVTERLKLAVEFSPGQGV